MTAKVVRTKVRACPVCKGYVEDHCAGKGCQWFLCSTPECAVYGRSTEVWTLPEQKESK